MTVTALRESWWTKLSLILESCTWNRTARAVCEKKQWYPLLISVVLPRLCSQLCSSGVVLGVAFV